MLPKLLKYDFKSVKRFGLPIVIALLVAFVLGVGAACLIPSSFMMIEANEEPSYILLLMGGILLMMAVIFIIYGAVFGIEITVMVDFYKTLVTDIGYLTFTLPVRAKDILRSKLINSSIWSFIVLVLCVLVIAGMVFGMVLFGIDDATDYDDYSYEDDYSAYEDYSLFTPLTTVLYIIVVPISFVNTQLVLFMAVFFGSVIAKKHKALTAIGCVIGVYAIYSSVSGIAMTILMFLTGVDMAIALNISLILVAIVLTGLNVLFFKLTEYMMEKKLNLA